MWKFRFISLSVQQGKVSLNPMVFEANLKRVPFHAEEKITRLNGRVRTVLSQRHALCDHKGWFGDCSERNMGQLGMGQLAGGGGRTLS